MCYNDSTSFGKKDLKEKGENWAQKKKKTTTSECFWEKTVKQGSLGEV